MLLFTENIDHTKVIVQYFPQMHPGTELYVVNPRLRGFIGDTNTVLLTTSQPSIPNDLYFSMINFPLNLSPKTRIIVTLTSSRKISKWAIQRSSKMSAMESYAMVMEMKTNLAVVFLQLTGQLDCTVTCIVPSLIWIE